MDVEGRFCKTVTPPQTENHETPNVQGPTILLRINTFPKTGNLYSEPAGT